MKAYEECLSATITRDTPYDFPQNACKAPAGIALNPQAAR